ncbi:MAG: hypothetical protein JSR66_05380 [Proteobacteria bacterium]|nr:hypothetical protein [Pseudomonadota bacterium]
MRQHLVRQAPAIVVCLFAAFTVFGADTPSEPIPPGYSTTLTGDMHDFDYFVGGWTTKQRRLKARGVGSSDWEEFTATECLSLYLDGQATVDELYMPAKHRAGLTVRAFDLQKHQWSIYWVSGEAGPLDPVVGGFQGNHGEFYATDEENHRPVKVRYLWDKIDHDHARWQQAFSFDNRTWETNWIGEFTRADTSKICENGRPRR